MAHSHAYIQCLSNGHASILSHFGKLHCGTERGRMCELVRRIIGLGTYEERRTSGKGPIYICFRQARGFCMSLIRFSCKNCAEINNSIDIP